MSSGRRPRFWKEEKSGKKSHGGRLPKSDNPSPFPFPPAFLLLPFLSSLHSYRICGFFSLNQVNGRTSERAPHISEGWTERRSGAKTRICLFCGAPISSTHSAKKQGAARKTAKEQTDSEGQLTLEPCCRPCPYPSVQGQFPTFMLRDTEGDFAPPDSVLLAAMGKMTMTEVSFPGRARNGSHFTARERKSPPTPLEMRIRRECPFVRLNGKEGEGLEISKVIR